MHEVNIDRLDLNLLKVFDALVDECSVTVAGERLKLSQPTVSHALARLREAFNDPLFVRSTNGLRPTSLALSLRDPVARALGILQEALEQRQVFDPALSRRTFNLALTDAGEMLFAAPLMACIRAAAPGTRTVIHQLSRQNDKEALESGDVDLAIGQLPHGQLDLVQQVLSVEPFEGYARKDHPILSNPTLEAFLAADHLVIGRPAVADLHVQRALGPLANKRRIALQLRHYLPAALVLAQADMIAVFPRILRTFPSFQALGRFTLPFEVEPVTMRQFWHARSTADEACKWLRAQVAALFTKRSTLLG